MSNATRFLTKILLTMSFFSIVMLPMPVTQAADPVKIVIPAIADKAGYRSNELNAALLAKLRSQVRFPKYEILLATGLATEPARPVLEKIAADNVAGGVVNLEITQLRNQLVHGFFDDETYEATSLTLTLTYFNKETGQFGRLSAERSKTEISSVFSGPITLSVATLEELLNQLDKIFPRQFPGPRY